jgi:hypothetical protein
MDPKRFGRPVLGRRETSPQNCGDPNTNAELKQLWRELASGEAVKLDRRYPGHIRGRFECFPRYARTWDQLQAHISRARFECLNQPEETFMMSNGSSPQRSAEEIAAEERLAKQLRNLRKSKPGEIEQIVANRKIDEMALRQVESFGVLRFGEVWDQPSWVLTDHSGRCAEARRLNNRAYPEVGDLTERKAHTLGGSRKDWPVGLRVDRGPDFEYLDAAEIICLVEGGPDYLAAWHFILAEPYPSMCLPATILGRGVAKRIHQQALKLCAKKRIRIFPHADADNGGLKRACDWAWQFEEAGCTVEIFDLRGLTKVDGSPVKDLNDLIELDPLQRAEIEGMLVEQTERVKSPRELAPEIYEESRNDQSSPDSERETKLYEKYSLLSPKKLRTASRELPPELITGILYRRRRMLLSGASKARKSWMMHQIAYCVANGISFLGRFPTNRNHVFYVNFELMEATSARRFDAIKEALDEGTQDNITVLSVADYLDLVGSDFAEYLALKARDANAKAVCLDPMWRLLDTREENSNSEVGQMLRPLVRFAREAEASVIGAHHYAKGNASQKEAIDRASGAGAFTRDPATVFTMTGHRESDAYTIEISGNDFAPVENFVVRFEYPLFRIDSSLDPGELKKPQSEESKNKKSAEQTEKVITALYVTDQEGGLTHAQLMRSTRIPKSSLTRVLKHLIEKEKKVYKSPLQSEGCYALTPWFRKKLDAETENDTQNGENL